MNKAEFMSRLTVALGGLPMEERQAALKYYEEYFEEAGPEREQEILSELGEPQQVAQSILQDYSSVPATAEQAAAEQAAADQLGGELHPDGAETAQSAYAAANAAQRTTEQSAGAQAAGTQTTATGPAPDFNEAAKQVRRTFDGARNYAERLRLPVWLWIIIAIFGLPVVLSIFGTIVGTVGGLLGVVMGLIGAAIGVIVGAFGIFFAVAAGGIAMVVGGISSIVVGAFRFVFDPPTGMLAIGIGALVASAGLLFCVLGWWLIKTILPKMWGWLTAVCRALGRTVRGWFNKGGK